MSSDKATTSFATAKDGSLSNRDESTTVPRSGDAEEGQLTKERPQSKQEIVDPELKGANTVSEPAKSSAKAQDDGAEAEEYSDDEDEPPAFPYGQPRGYPNGPVVGGRPQRPNRPRPK